MSCDLRHPQQKNTKISRYTIIHTSYFAHLPIFSVVLRLLAGSESRSSQSVTTWAMNSTPDKNDVRGYERSSNIEIKG